MARRSEGPIPPRESAPDLPAHLDETGTLTRHADLVAARITGLSGEVDAAHSRLAECAVVAASVDRLDLTGATLSDVRVTDLRATEVVARDGRWRNVEISGGRIGTLDLMRAELEGVSFTGVRIDYLSLPSATIADLLFTGCDIGTLDLPDARVERIAFADCRADEADTRGLRARDLDLRGVELLAITDPAGLRGATMTARQAELHAEAFAAALGLRIAAERP